MAQNENFMTYMANPKRTGIPDAKFIEVNVAALYIISVVFGARVQCLPIFK